MFLRTRSAPTRRSVNPIVPAPSINSGRGNGGLGFGFDCGLPDFAAVSCSRVVGPRPQEALGRRDVFLSGGDMEHG